tara:strand:+ start:295 stop:1302 length:1008 start_codon:yes stop_codon:yes gene_type:complete
MDNLDKKKIKKIYFCEICDFTTHIKSNYALHLNTKKHNLLKIQMDNKSDKKIYSKLSDGSWSCICGKTYKFQSGLCKHKHKCKIDTSDNTTSINNNDVNHIVQQIVKENKEFKKLLVDQQEQLKKQSDQILTCNETNDFKNLIIVQQEQLKIQQEQMKIQSQQLSEIIPKIGNNVNNTINQKFNINIFLNENCKNAINMSDFINSIKISLKELDIISSTGIANGLSTAIINNIQRLKVEQRPIHCTDVKRSTLYIKDNNEWACDISHQSIKNAIKVISGKPFFALQEWRDDNPSFMDDDYKQEYFAKALQEIGKSNIKIDDKIVKTICNHTYLKK